MTNIRRVLRFDPCHRDGKLVGLPARSRHLSAGTYQQAPMLDGRDLPPVDERLPDNPEVATPLEYVLS